MLHARHLPPAGHTQPAAAATSRDRLPPSVLRRRQVATASSQFYHEEVVHTVKSVSNWQDLSIVGSGGGPASWSPDLPHDKSPSPLTVPAYHHQMQGSPNRGLAAASAVHNSSFSFTSGNPTLSLKERLHRNQATLRALLSEENNPLRKRRNMQSQHRINSSLLCDLTLGGDPAALSVDTDSFLNVGSQNGLLQIRTETRRSEAIIASSLSSPPQRTANPEHEGLSQPPHSNLSHHSGCSPVSPSRAPFEENVTAAPSQRSRSLADQPQQRKRGVTKRYISPDSSHDSAVDMDTASLQSSPGSSDTQTTVVTRAPDRRDGGVLPSGGSVTNWPTDAVDSDDWQMSPLGMMAAGLVNEDHDVGYRQIQLVGRCQHSSKADSDVDSGIAPGLFPASRCTTRRDSSSSAENDAELPPSSRVHSVSKYSAVSSQCIRQTATPHPRAKYSGPLKADHTIQPASPRHTHREEIQNGVLPLHPIWKSMSELSVPEAPTDPPVSPSNRVRFEDEQPRDMRTEQLGAQAHEQVIIPPGCRARKLRGARRSAEQAEACGPLHPPDTRPLSATTGGRTRSPTSMKSSATHGLPPSGKHDDLKYRMQRRVRTRSQTPTETILAAEAAAVAVEAGDLRPEAGLAVHRASPVVVSRGAATPHSSHGQSRADCRRAPPGDGPASSDSERELHNEVAYFNGFNDAWMNALANPKKNLGEGDCVELPPGGSDRPNSALSQQCSVAKHSRSLLVSERPASCGAEIPGAGAPQKAQRSDKGERGARGADSRPPANRCERVQLHHQDDEYDSDNTYVMPPKPTVSHPKDSSPCVANHDDTIHYEDARALPGASHASDLEDYRSLSRSRTSLSGKMASFRQAAKNKWSAMRRAVSLERVDSAGAEEEGTLRRFKSPSLQSLASRFSFNRKKDRATFDDFETTGLPHTTSTDHQLTTRPSSAPIGKSRRHYSSMTSLTSVDAPHNFRPIGKLKQLNDDGSQILELVRPPHGPFGFYIARGNTRFGGGVFVSRLSDGLPGHFFAGLLGVGDEILEINCQPVTNLTLDEVYAMMAERYHLLIKMLPYMARKDT